MAECHPDREHKAHGLCLQCYSHSNYLANRELKQYAPKTCIICGELFTPASGVQKTCSDACREERYRQMDQLWASAPASSPDGQDSTRGRECRRRSNARPERKKYMREWNASPKGKDGIRRRQAKPGYQAAAFLRQNKDCTSTAGEVEAIFVALVSALDGMPCRRGKGDYHLDHIRGGPAIGMIPARLNLQLNETYLAAYDEAEARRWLAPAAVEYIKRRIALAASLAE